MVILLYNSPPPFPYTCHSAVQSTLHHLSPCTAILPTLDMPIWPVPLSHHTIYSLLLLSVSVCNTSVAQYSVCYAVITLLSVSPCRSPLHSHSNLSSPPISCLSTLLIYRPCISLPYQFLFKHSPHLPSVCFAFISYFTTLVWLVYSFCNFCCHFKCYLLSRLLAIFTNWSSLYSEFRYSTVFIISAFFVASDFNMPVPSTFHFTYNLYILALGDAFYALSVTFQFSCQFSLFPPISN